MWLKTQAGVLVNMDRMDAVRAMEVKKTNTFEVQLIKADGAGEWIVFVYAYCQNAELTEECMNKLHEILDEG